MVTSDDAPVPIGQLKAKDYGPRVWWVYLALEHPRTVAELSRDSGVSEATIRGHLRSLSSNGLIVADVAKDPTTTYSRTRTLPASLMRAVETKAARSGMLGDEKKVAAGMPLAKAKGYVCSYGHESRFRADACSRVGCASPAPLVPVVHGHRFSSTDSSGFTCPCGSWSTGSTDRVDAFLGYAGHAWRLVSDPAQQHAIMAEVDREARSASAIHR